MSYFIYDDSGRINFAYSEKPAVPEGQNLLASEVAVELGSRYYVENNALVMMPTPPSVESVFDYNTKQWVDQRTSETQWPIVRAERNQKLQACDWTQLSDIPAETKALWEPYRQALRDITDQPDPFNIIWPTPPQ
jgi:hypothetical protein